MAETEQNPFPGARSWSERARRLLNVAGSRVSAAGVRGFDAEDLATEALAALWHACGRGGCERFGDESLEALITTIAERKVIDFRRRRQARLRREQAGGPPTRDPPPPDLVDALTDAMRTLTAFERQVIELHVLHRLSFEDIGELTGVRSSEARSAAERATRLLRTLIGRAPE